MRVYFDIDLANNAQLFTDIVSKLATAGISITTGDAPASQTTTPEKPKKAHKLESVHDVVLKWVSDGTSVSYTTADGKYVGEICVRRVMNGRLRTAGATWDKDARKWVFASKDAVKAFVTSTSAVVTANEWQAQRDKAAERAAKRA